MLLGLYFSANVASVADNITAAVMPLYLIPVMRSLRPACLHMDRMLNYTSIVGCATDNAARDQSTVSVAFVSAAPSVAFHPLVLLLHP